MFLMYVDECGDSGTMPTSSRHFILSGIVMHESYWLKVMRKISNLRKDLQSKYGLATSKELHASHMIGRVTKEFSDIPRRKRLELFKEVLDFEADLDEIRVINVVIDKRGIRHESSPFDLAWTRIIGLFENAINQGELPMPDAERSLRINNRGMLIVDETDELKLRHLIRRMRHGEAPSLETAESDSSPSALRYVIEDPLHKNSKHAQAIQLSDTNAFFLKQAIEPNSTVKKHKARNYFHKLKPVLLNGQSVADENKGLESEKEGDRSRPLGTPTDT